MTTTTFTFATTRAFEPDEWAEFTFLADHLIGDVNRLVMERGIYMQPLIVGPNATPARIDADVVCVTCWPEHRTGTPIVVARDITMLQGRPFGETTLIYSHDANHRRIAVAMLLIAQSVADAIQYILPTTPSTDIAMGVKLARLVRRQYLPVPIPQQPIIDRSEP